jgi:hypothetical protein
VKVTLATAGTSMPCADSSTIYARRQVTTDPELRRTMRSSRLPSWLVMLPTRTRSASLDDLDVAGKSCIKQAPSRQLIQPDEANDAGGRHQLLSEPFRSTPSIRLVIGRSGGLCPA